MDSFITIVGVVWEYVKVFASSNFFIVIVSAGVGAFGGALGAQMISEKTRRREDLQKEIRNTNTAIMMSFSICNTYLMLKENHVAPLKENFEQQNRDLEEFERSRMALNGENAVFAFQANFLTIPPLSTRTDQLQMLAFEKISLNGRPLALVDALTNTIHSLNIIVAKRNQLIETYQAQRPIQDKILKNIYFGRPDDHGHVDSNYPDTVEGIHNQTDDCVFFSKLLCDDLIAHGKMLVERYEKTISKRDVPTVNQTDFAKSEQKGLMPNPASYADWTSSFMKLSDKKNK